MADRFLLPPGRMVEGDVHKKQEKDGNGNPHVYKRGPKMGQPRDVWYYGVAIPKRGEQHWAQTEWGAKIWAAGHAFLPNAGQLPTFAWKIVDGDSQVPNQSGRKPCEKEGFPGHWVIRISGGFAPTIYTAVNVPSVQRAPVDLQVNLGDYVQAEISTEGNGDRQKPGVYINVGAVCFQGFGPRIERERDAASIGFATSMPAGAMAAPPGVAAMPPVPAAMPPVPAAMPPVPAAMPPMAAPMPPVPPIPNPAFLQVPVPVMTEKATSFGLTYEALKGANWTDEQMRQNGFLV